MPSNLIGLVAGSTRNGEIKIIRPGGRDFVLPIIQSIQYLPFTQNTIGFQVTAEDENKINVNVSAVTPQLYTYPACAITVRFSSLMRLADYPCLLTSEPITATMMTSAP